MARVLLVEDNEMTRDMLSRRLARRGYEVLVAVDGTGGAGRAEFWPPGGAQTGPWEPEDSACLVDCAPAADAAIRKGTMRDAEPILDVAQLAHVELLTPKPAETLRFFTELLGMRETARSGGSVYLRAYEDFYHHTLKITEAPRPGLGHVAWRAMSRPALERRVAAVEASGLGRGWCDGDLGHGAAYRFATPDGHPMELIWDVEYYRAPEAERSLLKNRPERRPLQGVPVRRIDHVNLMAADVPADRAFMVDRLGLRLRERVVDDAGVEQAVWMSVSPLVHEVAFMRDRSGVPGRLHHVCYWYGYPQHLTDAVEMFNDRGIAVEHGPGKHGISQASYLYVREPGGNRVELFGDCGYLIFDPTWEPVTWTAADTKRASWVGDGLSAEFYAYGTPEPVSASV